MTEKKVQLTIDIKGTDSVGKANEKTKSLKSELRQLKQELASGKLSGQEFLEASKRAGQLQDRIGDINNRVKHLASDTGKLDAFMSVGQGIAGGFAAMQGAMALFGSENEQMQKAIMKTQGAISLLNGVQALANTLNKDSAIMVKLNTFLQTRYTAAVGTTTGAMKLLRIAGMALGIGAIVVGIGLLIANFDKVKKAVLNLIPGLAQLAEFFGNIWEKITDFVGVTSDATRAIDKQEEAFKKNSKQADRQIELLEAMGGKENEIFAIKQKRLKQEIDLLALKKKHNEATDEELDKLDDLQNTYKAQEIANNKRLEKIKQDEAKAASDAAKRRKEEFKKIADAKKAEEQKITDIMNEENEKRLAWQMTDQEKEIFEVEKRTQERLKLVKEGSDAEKLILENARIEKGLIDIKYLEQQLEQEDIIRQEKNARLQEQQDEEKRIANETAEFYKELENKKTQYQKDSFEMGLQLLGMLGQRYKGFAIAQLAIEKSAAIARVVNETQKEIAGYASNPFWTAMPDGGASLKSGAIIAAKVRAGLSIATIAATGIQQGKQSLGGSGGSGTRVPNVAGTTSTRTAPTQPQPIKVIVTETDIRRTTRRVDDIYTQATIQ